MIPFYDLKSINSIFEDDFRTVFKDQLNASDWILGQSVKQFEAEWNQYLGTTYTVGTSNGHDALFLIFKAYIELGLLKKGDGVLVTNHTYIASVLSIIHAGLQPVLVDFDSGFMPNLKHFETCFSSNIKAVMVVHLYGQISSDIFELKVWCEHNNLLLIEDAAQAHGAILNGKKAGSFGDAASFSFYPTKNLGCLGDGGAVVTNNQLLYDVVKTLSNYGSCEKYQHNLIGYNQRLDSLQAAFLSVKLPNLDEFNKKRIQVAQWYHQYLNNPKVELPQLCLDGSHIYHLFIVRCTERDKMQAVLNNHQIQTMIHYPFTISQHKAFNEVFDNNSLIYNVLSNEILSLPMSPLMTEEDVELIAKVVNDF